MSSISRRVPDLRVPKAVLAAALSQFLAVAPPAPPSCSTTTATGEDMTATVAAPLPGTLVTGYEPCPVTVRVDGTASIGSPLFDFYFVIDSSGSTRQCSNADIDGDGLVGVDMFVPPFGSACTDLDDTVLAAEVKAVRDFVATLSPATSRVAIIEFSNPEGFFFSGARQRIVAPLTSDFTLVNSALDETAAGGGDGATDYGGGLSLLIDEFTANGQPATRRQLAYFLSDGVPTFPDPPFGSENPGDAQAAIDAADDAAAAGIVVNTFGVGFVPGVSQDPVVPLRCTVPLPSGSFLRVSTLECIALRTGGEFFASPNPADIVDQIRRVLPPGIDSVTVFNDTTGASAPATLTVDGLWAADVPVEIGVANALRVVVLADDGTTCEMATSFTSLCFAGACDPRTQGYWHRQCLGLGQIPGRNQPAPHPDWDPALLAQLMVSVTDPLIQDLGSPPDPTTCLALDANPPDDSCQRAIKQYAAVLMNVHAGRLAPDCALDFSELGPGLPTDPAGAVELLAQLIEQGLAGDEDACKRANDIADLINTGAAL